MKVIDLLNKIANGEEVPKKIKYAGYIYYLDNEWKGVCYRREDDNIIFENFFVFENLNEEVEIIEDTPKEDKKIEKLKIYDNSIDWCCNGRAINDIEKDIIDKINEIIDKLNGE